MNLPDDQEAERSLFATVCAEGYEHLALEASQALHESDFLNPRHSFVFRAMCLLLSTSTPINIISLKDALGENIGRVGGFEGLGHILQGEIWGKVGPIINIVKKNKLRRDLIGFSKRISISAYSDDCIPGELILNSINDLACMSTSTRQSGLQLYGDISKSMEDAKNSPISKPVPIGMSKLDKLFRGGFRPGELNILAARPGIGKTSMALKWAVYIATRCDVPVAYFSLEMPKDEIWKRALSIYSGISVDKIENDSLDYGERTKLNTYNHELNASCFMICDNTAVTPQGIGLEVDKNRSKMERNFGLVVLDYLQLMDSDNEKAQTETLRIGGITRSLKKKARDWGSSVLLLSQLNRDVEKRDDGIPRLSDLRDSGSIEQDADKVMFIHRKMKPVAEGEEPDRTAQLLLSKQRIGPTGIVHLYWDGETTTYNELTGACSGRDDRDDFTSDCR